MKQILIVCLVLLASCNRPNPESHNPNSNNMTKQINKNLPTVGILIFESFLTNEVVAPLDVFTKKDTSGAALFNVVLIAKEDKPYVSEEGLQVMADFTIENAPALNVLVVPSSNTPDDQVRDKDLIRFIKQENETTEFIASHCAGAFMLGEAGVADNKKVVTYCSGGEKLQNDYPNLLVMDDAKVAVVRDGKIISSNGNLVSYLASLDLLEEMTSKAHRSHVEEELLIDKLK